MAISLRPSSFQPGLDRDKFKELLLYVADRCAADPRFGSTKLNKILFFADFMAYGKLGQPITGAAYQKLPKGPAARAMVPVVKELEERQEAVLVKRDHYGKTQKRLVARRAPDLSRFSAQEVAIVDRVIEGFWKRSAAAASEFSHEEVLGWQLAELNEDIPYQTVFLSCRQPTSQDLDRGKELAQEHGWL